MDDFYEEDEPVADLLAILARPPDGVTIPRGVQGVPVAPGVWAVVASRVEAVA